MTSTNTMATREPRGGLRRRPPARGPALAKVPLSREKAPRYRRIHKAVTLPRALRSPGCTGRAPGSHPGRSIPALHMPMHPSMSNVDAVRMRADEHHLEFVDLERFNLDASAF